MQPFVVRVGQSINITTNYSASTVVPTGNTYFTVSATNFNKTDFRVTGKVVTYSHPEDLYFDSYAGQRAGVQVRVDN